MFSVKVTQANLAKRPRISMIAEDLSHSVGDQWYYCFGWVGGGVPSATGLRTV